MIIETHVGDHISRTVDKLMALARLLDEYERGSVLALVDLIQFTETPAQLTRLVKGSERPPVMADFNGVIISAMPGQRKDDILRNWRAGMDESFAEYRNKQLIWERTPEGIAEIERRRLETERRNRILLQEGERPCKFSFFGPRGEEAWEYTVAANQDGYGSATVRYAARWANWMEREMLLTGARFEVEAIADRVSHEADLEGVTGFMHGCAVSILARCWKHGERLRRWHNLETSPGIDGLLANADGGVLNPAILSGLAR